MTHWSERVGADIRDKAGWSAFREDKIGASDAAKFSKLESVPLYVNAKLMPSWDGGEYADWGNAREAQILADHGFTQNHFTIWSEFNNRFIGTPDGIEDGPVPRLIQVKTTSKRFKTIPLSYRRQVQWELFCVGVEQTVFLWEFNHRDVFGNIVPDFDSQAVIIDRDDEMIASMVTIAGKVLEGLDLSKF